MDPGPARRRLQLLGALVAASTAAAFLPALRGEFLYWDDDQNFLANPSYRGLSLASLKWMATTFLLGHWHPLTWLTLALDYGVWGMNPAGYHLTSILFHAANAVLVFFVLRSLLRLSGRGDVDWPAALGALLFGLHPQRVESVAWITERRDVVCGLFALLTVLFYLKRVEAERKALPSGRWLALSVAAFAASLMSKALSITLPALLLLLDLFPLGRAGPGSRRRILVEKIPYLALSVADAAVMIFAMRSIDAVHGVTHYAFLDRAAQAAYGLCFYPLKLLWPHPLLPIYPLEAPLRPTEPRYLLAMTAVIAVSAALIFHRRRCPAALTAWAAYVVLLLPVLGIGVTGMQIAADRYTYLALIPAAALAAAGSVRLPTRALFAGAGAWLLALGAVTWIQCGVWRNSLALWSQEIRHEPHLYFPLYSRAHVRGEQGEFDGALADINASLALNPNWETSWMERGTLLALQGDHRRAIADFDRSLELNPASVNALSRRALSRSKLGDVAGALSDCDLAIHQRPASPIPYSVRGNVLLDRGDARGAVAEYTRSLDRDPQAPEVYRNRARAETKLGMFPEALADHTRSLEIRPQHAETLVDRATLRGIQG